MAHGIERAFIDNPAGSVPGFFEMNPEIQEWLHLLVRMAHLIAGIMWIGTSFYFVWLDSAFKPMVPAPPGVDGELYMVHGGFFYRVEKRHFGAGEAPPGLHWFKWEATFTWITGFLLLWLVYYSNKGAYLIDPSVKALSPHAATLAGLGFLVGGWLVYDLLFRSPLAKTKLINPVALALAGGLVWVLTHTFSGRGAFIHLGAVFGTIMVLNVWVHILPNQRKMLKDASEGKTPDQSLGLKAKRRSIHNSYMTLPVLFTMISNHFANLHGHPQSWLVLSILIVTGALVRRTMITGHKLPASIAAALIVFLVVYTAPKAPASAVSLGGEKVPFSEVQTVIAARCTSCHAPKPTDELFMAAGPPLGIMLDTPERIQTLAPRIYERTCVQKSMPLMNRTGITEAERDVLARWFSQGAGM